MDALQIQLRPFLGKTFKEARKKGQEIEIVFGDGTIIAVKARVVIKKPSLPPVAELEIQTFS